MKGRLNLGISHNVIKVAVGLFLSLGLVAMEYTPSYAQGPTSSLIRGPGFAGEWMWQDNAASTPLLHLRARTHLLSEGRFLQRDPFAGFLDVPQTQNQFYYTNNPVNWIDPSGYSTLHFGGNTPALINSSGANIDTSLGFPNIENTMKDVYRASLAQRGVRASDWPNPFNLGELTNLSRSLDDVQRAANWGPASLRRALPNGLVVRKGNGQEPDAGSFLGATNDIELHPRHGFENGVFRHELAHAIDYKCSRYDLSRQFMDATGGREQGGKYYPGSGSPTEYGKTDRYEDFAETFQEITKPNSRLLLTPERERFIQEQVFDRLRVDSAPPSLMRGSGAISAETWRILQQPYKP